MNVGFFSEAGYEGKVSRNHPNMRTDVAWVCALNATHHPLPKIQTLSDNLYDIGVMILPKKREMLLDYPLLEQYRRVCKKVTVMQESYYNYWHDSPIAEQIWYFNFIASMDLIFCHNDIDLRYYGGLTNVRTELMPTVMITDGIVRRNEWSDGTIIGVQLGTAAAGTFNLNCSFHGIPCIAYSNSNTQRILHPLTTVELGEIDKAKEIANKLKDDKFYKLCMETTQKRYEAHYSEEKFFSHIERIFVSLR